MIFFIFKGNDLFKYKLNTEYTYRYSTKTKLWINDVSDEAVSNLYLNATVVLQLSSACLYQLKLQDVVAYGGSITDYKAIAEELQRNVAVFGINRNGALSESVKFNGREAEWSRNVKRGIISAFQLRSENDLRVSDPSNPNPNEPKSSVIYETDLFGRCRTVYKLKKAGADSVEIVKKKALHRCSLDHSRNSPVQSEEYNSIAVSRQGFYSSLSKLNIILF